MSDPTDFPGPPDVERQPGEGLISMRDRLPLGVSLLALAVAIVALVIAVDDDNTQTTATEAGTEANQPSATQRVHTTTTLGTVQTIPLAPTTTTAQQIVTAVTVDESDTTPDEPERLVLSVVGIGHDSNLNLRDAPQGQVIATLGSQATGIVPTGTTRSQADTTWLEVHAAGLVGWVSGEYVAPLGGTFDATSQVVSILGELPGAETLTGLGRTVANALASTEPESRVSVSGAPVVGAISEITMDVVGQPDDSVQGFRLRVFAKTNEGGVRFALHSVESTVMCYSQRGVSSEGLCN